MEQNIEALAEKLTGLLFVPLEASGRHVHLTKDTCQVLFGHGLTPERPLSQPGQYLARERVTLRGPKGEFTNVAVLGPERKENQVEVSLTDARQLGIQAPLRHSGDIQGTPGILLETPRATVRLERGVLAAKRHIHLNPEQAANFGVTDKQEVTLQTYTARPVLFQKVLVRVRPDFEAAVHLDYDEANSCGFQIGDLGRILP